MKNKNLTIDDLIDSFLNKKEPKLTKKNDLDEKVKNDIAVIKFDENIDSVVDLNKVLKRIFPFDQGKARGTARYYGFYLNSEPSRGWTGMSIEKALKKEIIPLSNFLL